MAYAGHVLMENRNGLVSDVCLTGASGTAERGAALMMLDRRKRRKRITLGGDKACGAAKLSADGPTQAYLKGSPAPNAVNRWPQLAHAWINHALAAIQGGHRFIDPMPGFCQTGECVYQDHGVYLFGDRVHYSAAGSDRAVCTVLAPALATITGTQSSD